MSKLSSLFVSLLLFVVIISGCTPRQPDDETSREGDAQASGTPGTSGDVTSGVTASDGFVLAAKYVEAGSGTPACILLHQYGSNKESYEGFQSALADKGISSLAIDLRGHGESNPDNVDIRTFDVETWTDMTGDIRDAIGHLKSLGHDSIGIVGASISANLAIIALADMMLENPETAPECLVLLSPGVNYKGVQPIRRCRDLEQIPTLIISSTGDEQSYPGAQSMSNAARNSELISFEGTGHGTNLLESEPELVENLTNWLSENLQ